jgi:CheY-like chemotaxis protein
VLTFPRALCVLIVDDYPDTATSCAELLEFYGYDTRTADGAGAALALLDEWQPDVALVDLRMPGMDGFELTRWLRVRCARCPLLVAVTGLSTKAYRERATEVGFDYFLVKPVDPNVMTDLLRRCSASLSPGESGVSQEVATMTPARRATRNGNTLKAIKSCGDAVE